MFRSDPNQLDPNFFNPMKVTLYCCYICIIRFDSDSGAVITATQHYNAQLAECLLQIRDQIIASL